VCENGSDSNLDGEYVERQLLRWQRREFSLRRNN
jgi:hypothetical protein